MPIFLGFWALYGEHLVVNVEAYFQCFASSSVLLVYELITTIICKENCSDWYFALLMNSAGINLFIFQVNCKIKLYVRFADSIPIWIKFRIFHFNSIIFNSNSESNLVQFHFNSWWTEFIINSNSSHALTGSLSMKLLSNSGWIRFIINLYIQGPN